MANSNPRLEVALAQFATRPGTMLDQKAQSHTAFTVDANHLITRFAATLVAFSCVLTLSACATTSKPIPPTKEVSAMATSQSASATSNPNLTAEEIGKRFLKLIEGLKSREDLSLARVQDITGLKLAPAVRGEFYGAEGDLGREWKYALNFYPESRSSAIGVQLHFMKSNERFGDMTQVCSLDFDHYHSALKAMGYRDVPIYGEIGQLESWRYYKDGIMLLIIPQNVVAGEAGRVCVKSIHAELS